MSDETQNHLRNLYKIHTKRLRVLEIKQATLGTETPPSILIEIDELREKIALLEPQLSNMVLPASSVSSLDSSVAHKNKTTNDWNDIALPTDKLMALRGFVVQVRHRSTVSGKQGPSLHQSMGRGMCALFVGSWSAGKTMAAELLANDLELGILKVDLSILMGKSSSETEKNLDKMFNAARETNAILFFDETDALFSKRSEVRDTHDDRYANIEVSYLLHKIENYNGVVILAANLRKNFDAGFVRRLHIMIDFPVP